MCACVHPCVVLESGLCLHILSKHVWEHLEKWWCHQDMLIFAGGSGASWKHTQPEGRKNWYSKPCGGRSTPNTLWWCLTWLPPDLRLRVWAWTSTDPGKAVEQWAPALGPLMVGNKQGHRYTPPHLTGSGPEEEQWCPAGAASGRA